MWLCVDVDTDYNLKYSILLSRLLYEYNYLIPRKVIKTRGGYHVYLNIPCDYTKDREFYIYLLTRFGDDDRRIERDFMRFDFMTVNVCFNDSELYEVKRIVL